MFLTAHTPLSLIIGSQTANPLVAFLLAFLGHFVLDAIPHDSLKLHNWLKNKKLSEVNKIYLLIEILEFILIFIFLSWLYGQHKLFFSTSLVAALVGGYLPDVLWGIKNLIPKKIKFLEVYQKIHSFIDEKFLIKYFLLPTYLEALSQVICFVFFTWLYLKFI